MPIDMPDVDRTISGICYSATEYDKRIFDVSFHYSPRDPLAVRLVHQTRQGNVPWIFDIGLLEDGVRSSVGEGDVRVQPHDVNFRPEVRVDYLSNLGVFTSIYPQEMIAEFLRDVEAKYPRELRDELYQRFFDVDVWGHLSKLPKE